jgi:two-component system KDP operon response regulator KdpE
VPEAEAVRQSSAKLVDASLLLVDDDEVLASTVSKTLRAQGYRVSVAANGGDALTASSIEEPDVILLDLGLPDIDGIDVCRQLRRWFRNPIVVLSGDLTPDRKIDALDEGADDYITKPFSMQELNARIRVALRHRALVAAVVDATVVNVGDLIVDTGDRSVFAGTRALDLTRKQFDLLALLARNPGRVVTHGTLLARVWGDEGGTAESLRVHVTHLRHKLGTGVNRPRIVSEPGVGYRLVVESE